MQRPRFHAYEHDDDAIRRWLEGTWPAIRKEAKQVRAQVYFVDEVSMRSNYQLGTTWGVRGETAAVAKPVGDSV